MNSTSGITYGEVTDSITGFDELAVEKHIGLDLYNTDKSVMRLRALVFVHLRHQGVIDTDARKQALEMTSREVSDYFADDEPVLDGDTPVTEVGKGDEQPS